MAKVTGAPATEIDPLMTDQDEYMLGDLIFRRNPYTSPTNPMVPTGPDGQWESQAWPLEGSTSPPGVQWWPFAGRSLSVAAALLIPYRYQRADGSIGNEELLVGYERELQDAQYPSPILNLRLTKPASVAAASTHQHRAALGDLICDENPFPHSANPPEPMRVTPGWQAAIELDPAIQRWWTPFSPSPWRRVRRAFRVPYFWRIPDPNDGTKKIEVWEYVLIGYVGAGGGF